jgi:hypothetical protein
MALKQNETLATIAHAWNNELTEIVNGLQLVLETLPAQHPLVPMLRELENAAWRCSWRSKDLMLLAGISAQAPPQMMDLDIAA